MARLKVGVIKIGSRISSKEQEANGNMGEILTITSMFQYVGADIKLITAIPKRKEGTPNDKFNYDHVENVDILECYNNVNDLGLEVLVVVGGTINFFGGFDGNLCCETYKIINTFKGRILFFYTDPMCGFKQLWNDKFYKRNEKWGTNWTEEDLNVTRTDMTMISADTDIEAMRELQVKKHLVIIDDIQVYEWQKLTLFGDNPDGLKKSEKIYDLIYGGFYRTKTRHKQMMEYFHSVPYDAKFFGKIKPEHFEHEKNVTSYPIYEYKSEGWSFYKQRTNESIATIVFAEDSYCDRIVTMRVYASVLSGVVVFIEDKYDSKHAIFKDNIFRGFNYVKNSEDVDKKLTQIKMWTDEQYDTFINLQRDSFDMTHESILSGFSILLSTIMNEDIMGNMDNMTRKK